MVCKTQGECVVFGVIDHVADYLQHMPPLTDHIDHDLDNL